jgi:transcriptional regulatory protein RtcR
MTRKKPAARKETVVISALGTTLDAGLGERRWDRWRPTVALCQHDDLLIDRLELLYDPSYEGLADHVLDDVAHVSPETKIVRRPIALPDPWDFERVYAALLDFAREREHTPEREDLLVHITTGSHVMQICFFLLVESRHLPGRLLQTSPQKGHDPGRYDLIDLDLGRYDLLKSRFAAERDETLSALKAGIATKNARFNALVERIEAVALRTRDPILLMGPTGAGKSQLARRIYALKRERGLAGPWVEVNCATLRGDAAMSALFGHVKGAFTGAERARPGLLRHAHGGMLFLDEIGELAPDEQAMLLHAIEDKRFLPVGADEEVEVELEVIAGTNKDLRRATAAGEFREDLLARIDTWTFVLPPLTERREDIEPNLDYELERASERQGLVVSMNAEARRSFLKFATSDGARWTGNFRDLSAAVLRMATLAPRGRIDATTVGEEITRLTEAWSSHEPPPSASPLRELLGAAFDDIDRFDRVQLEEVVRVCTRAPSLSAAGRELFAQSRARRSSTNDADRLRKYLARFGLSFADLAR